MKINRVIQIPIKPNEKTGETRKEAARLWNNLVKLHKYIRRRGAKNPGIWLWPGCNDFEKHFRGKYYLHSQTVQAIIQKFFANIATIRRLRKSGNGKARYPHRFKPFFNPIFKGQSVKVFGNRIRIPLGNRQYLWFTIPDTDGRIVQVELGYNRLYITVQKEIQVPVQTSDKAAGLDFGIIHTAVVTDGVNSIAIVGRGIRSIKQGHARNLAKLNKKIAKTEKGSKRRKKLLRKKYELIDRKNNLIRNALHQTSRIIVNFCADNNVAVLVAGDLAGINSNTKGKRRRRNNQEIGLMEFGTLYRYLEYKLAEQGIRLVKISEAYTSQTCPACGNRKKVSGRVYKCRCGFCAPRDAVGAHNIRNLYVNDSIVQGFSVPSKSLKYLRPIRIKACAKSCGRSSLPVTPAEVAWEKSIRPAFVQASLF